MCEWVLDGPVEFSFATQLISSTIAAAKFDNWRKSRPPEIPGRSTQVLSDFLSDTSRLTQEKSLVLILGVSFAYADFTP